MATLTSFKDISGGGSPDNGSGQVDTLDVPDADGGFSSEADNAEDDQEGLMGDGLSVSYHGKSKRRTALSLKRKVCILATTAIIVIAVIIVAIVAGKKDCLDSIGDDVIYVPAWDQVRLPENVVPKSYGIDLHPNLTSSHVHGSSVIEFQVTSGPQDVILVHAKTMNITARSLMKVTSTGMEAVQLNMTFFSKSNDFYVVIPLAPLSAGFYHLATTFDYSLSSGLVGFYSSEYKDSVSGETRKLATTQFEPTDARRAFPCFDEPGMKAVFNISMVRDHHHTALSNMDIIRNETIDGGRLVKVHFNSTVRMSTYLVAFIVSDFEFVQGVTNSSSCRPIKVRVWCRQQAIDQTQLALSAAIDIISYYESFYNICYPLDKQDLVAIPDFAAGAMENWGLITYRETALLYNNAESSSSNKQRVVVVIAHELAHQWFGDLVTMQWWNGLWLNEGFATFMEYIGTSHYARGKWDMQLQFMVDDFERALGDDSLPSSHPILADVASPDQINEIFDSISYSKGGSVLRMLQGVLGEEAFIKGIQRYLKKHKYGNARTADLWAAMDEIYKLTPNVSSFMDTWTLQMGYPLITVTKTGSGGQLQASQERFLIGGNGSVENPRFKSPYGYVWHVPINFQTNSQQPAIKPVFLHKNPITITPNASYQWVKLNIGQKFFYRVNYNADNWAALTQQLTADSTVFSIADRAGLIDDAFALADDGRVGITTALATTDYLELEDNYVPWVTASDNLNHIQLLLRLRPSYGKFKAYYLKKVQTALHRLGYSDTGTHTERLLRTVLLHKSCDLGDSVCIDNSTAAIYSWMETGGPSPIAPNFRNTYYQTAVANGGEAEWNFFWSVYQNATVAVEKRKCLYALAQSKELWLLKRYLQWSLDENMIRSQDATTVMVLVARNPYGQEMAWKFLRENWDTLLERFGDGSFSFSYLIRALTSSFVTPFDLQEVKSFFTEHPNAASGQRATQQTQEVIQSNINWLAKNEKQVTTWLTQKGF